ncbi:MAG: hypothetical protein MZU95_07835 [Desulfomicrobium escambiense]|nr:hypothetical protein [Desulfomicrobium escambiense]
MAGRVDDVDLVVRARRWWWRRSWMVMPRSCSCSIQSMVASPSSTSPSL